MKSDILANKADGPCGSMDSTSLDSESDVENMDELRGSLECIRDFKLKLADAEQKNVYLNEKIKLYEGTIRDKNDLIDSINQTKELMIKQLKDQISDLQKALDLSKNLTINKVDTNPAESAESEKKTSKNADFQRLQKQFDKSQSQITSLLDDVSQLKAEMLELKLNKNDVANIKAKFTTEEDNLRAKIAKVENKPKEKDVDEFEGIDSSPDDPIVLLNHSMVPNIKFTEIGDQNKLAIIEDIPSVGPDWMVILRRFDGSVNFHGNGFGIGIGELSGEFWFGLESIHKLTSSCRHELYIELVDFDDVRAYARYDNFVIGSEKEFYALKSLGAYFGTAGDALRSHENSKLDYRYDDNNYYYWWFSAKNNQCCLTGTYKKSREVLTSDVGMYWGNWYLEKQYPLKACKMLIRPCF